MEGDVPIPPSLAAMSFSLVGRCIVIYVLFQPANPAGEKCFVEHTSITSIAFGRTFFSSAVASKIGRSCIFLIVFDHFVKNIKTVLNSLPVP